MIWIQVSIVLFNLLPCGLAKCRVAASGMEDASCNLSVSADAITCTSTNGGTTPRLDAGGVATCVFTSAMGQCSRLERAGAYWQVGLVCSMPGGVEERCCYRKSTGAAPIAAAKTNDT